MATQTASVSRSRRKPFRTGLHQLPVRRLGFKNVPAIPVDIPGMVDTLLKLGVRTKQYEQPLQGLSRAYTIAGSTARAYEFLYGDEEADAKRASARERLHGFLRGNPSEIHPTMAAEKLDEQDEEPAQHHLTTLSLDDPTQWSMAWTTLPDVYRLGRPHLDEWAATVDVAYPDKATEAFFPTIARYGGPLQPAPPEKSAEPGPGNVAGAVR